MSEISEKKLSKARKLKKLAEGGIDGEKTSARSAYDAYIAKHGIKDSDVSPELNQRVLTAGAEDEKDLLLTIILSVNPYARYKQDKLTVSCDLDSDDFAEVTEKYDYFSKLWRIEKEMLVAAFFSKHKKYMMPNGYALHKWRDRKVENQAIQDHKSEMDQVNEEYFKIQSDLANKKKTIGDVLNNVIESNDRVKTMAFNANRAKSVEGYLLESNYKNDKKGITENSSVKNESE